jgi:hypothetical protein
VRESGSAKSIVALSVWCVHLFAALADSALSFVLRGCVASRNAAYARLLECGVDHRS